MSKTTRLPMVLPNGSLIQGPEVIPARSARLQASAQLELDAALASAWASLRASLDELRRECAPVVGPELTCRGRVIRPAQRVPVNPSPYYAARWEQTREAVKTAWREISETAAHAFGAVQTVALGIQHARDQEASHRPGHSTNAEGDHPDET